MIVYKIVNKINKKVYIGQTVQPLQKRIAFHIWHNETPIQKALNKYGKNNFMVMVVDEAGSREVLNEKEQYWIKELNCKAPNGYNLTDGGEGLYCPSEETRRKIGEKSKGRKWSTAQREKYKATRTGQPHPISEQGKENIRRATKKQVWTKERREKLSKTKKGIKLTEDHINNIRKARTGWRLSEETKKKISDAKIIMSDETKKKMGVSKIGNKYFLGRKHTNESRKKISLAKIGHVFSEESKKKMSLAHIGHKPSEETREKKRIAMRAVWAQRRKNTQSAGNRSDNNILTLVDF